VGTTGTWSQLPQHSALRLERCHLCTVLRTVHVRRLCRRPCHSEKPRMAALHNPLLADTGARTVLACYLLRVCLGRFRHRMASALSADSRWHEFLPRKHVHVQSVHVWRSIRDRGQHYCACSFLPTRSRSPVTPNPSFKPTRYGRQRKPGLRHLVHHLSPGLRRLPPRAA